jgi:hypothetical protein
MNGPAESSDDSGTATLDKRVRRLEAQLETLIEAVEVLARGLEALPTTGPPGNQVEKAARRTHELLLLGKSSPST